MTASWSNPCVPGARVTVLNYSLRVTASPNPIHRSSFWAASWLALLPPLYILSPLALIALPRLRALPTGAKILLAFYALSQQLPALFSPEPLLASALALLRTLLLFGLMGVGVALGQTDRLKPVSYGLLFVYVTALIYGLFGHSTVDARLIHPYMTPITLGLAGAFGIWLALFAPGSTAWKLLLGISGLTVLLLSGSRGPIAAALVGCLCAFLFQRGRRIALALGLGIAVVLLGTFIGSRYDVGSLSRLRSTDTTGRDIVWYHTLSVIESQPWSGVGTYRLGKYLASPGPSCTLFPATNGLAPPCPEWIQRTGSPWLIAHNVTLQQWAETGPLGWIGLFALLGAVLTSCLQSRSPLGLAIVSGLLVATINDNTLLVPSPFFAELFWIVAGIQLIRFTHQPWTLGLLNGAVALGMSLPALAVSLPFPARPEARYSLISAPHRVTSVKDYAIRAQFQVPAGEYRASLSTCTTYCVVMDTKTFTSGPSGAPAVQLQGTLQNALTQRVQLRLLNGQSSLDIRPLGIKQWNVVIYP